MPITETQKHLIHAAVLTLIGALIAIALHDYTLELQRQNDELMRLNMQLLNENNNLRWCVPRSNGRAVITIINNRPFCEVHNVVS
jgi:hypothetical protein